MGEAVGRSVMFKLGSTEVGMDAGKGRIVMLWFIGGKRPLPIGPFGGNTLST